MTILKGQCQRVFDILMAGEWWTLGDISSASINRFGHYDSEAGISARLRELRSKGYIIEKRRRREGYALMEYRMVIPALDPKP